MLAIAHAQRSAKVRAKADEKILLRADQQFGKTLESVRGHAPRFLGVAHILRVNRYLRTNPGNTGSTNGFMLATLEQAADSGLKLDDMSNLLKCAYAWMKDLNALGRDLYNNYASLFPSPDVSFWMTTYLRQTLGDGAFNYIWGKTIKTPGHVYDELTAYINNLSSPIPSWTLPKLQKLVLLDLEYVKTLWLIKGPQRTEGFGMPPYLDDNRAIQIFSEKT